ncbi:DUF6178 family protein [Oligoflexus tunisiensis]|uniref:DUF6178 family protein n=1 Tax=Oligoflexus tunisiensis TaxID=708132 RepID=UPI00114D0267|nr:DUF6178 family protein [Oligoflexus tunisiensis]
MENRLSDSFVAASLDAGHQNLAWEPGPPSGFLAGIDLKAILADPNAADIVPELPTQALYYALKQQSIEEVLDLLPLLSPEQVERMLDYDAWSQDELVPKKFFEFLKPFGEISREQLYERFADLDEEYQLAALQGFFKVHEVEDPYDLPEAIAEKAYRMPCNRVFYEILSEDPDEVAFIEELMESLRENNMRYAYAVLGHATYQPPGEALAQVARFRRGRLEDEGFVSYEESLGIFAPIDHTAFLRKWTPLEQSQDLTSLALQGGSGLFLDAVLLAAREENVSIDELYNLHQSFLQLANALCAAAQVGPEDVAGLNRLLEQGKALVSLGLEYLGQGDLGLGIKIVRGESARTLFRVGLSLVDVVRDEVIQRLEGMQWPRIERMRRFYTARQWGQILLELDRHWLTHVGLQAGEIFKGLFNRFPMVPMRMMQDQNRIIFAPIVNLRELIQLEKNLQTIMGYLYAATWSGLPLNQPVDLILRESAMATIRRAGEDSNVPRVLEQWRQRLTAEAAHWWVGEKDSLDEIVDAVIDMIHEELHGLIVLPRASRQSHDSQSEVPST